MNGIWPYYMSGAMDTGLRLVRRRHDEVEHCEAAWLKAMNNKKKEMATTDIRYKQGRTLRNVLAMR